MIIGNNGIQEMNHMKKNKPQILKNVDTHHLEIHSIDHQLETSEEFFPTLLDPEGTLADAYVLHLKNEFNKSGQD